MRERPLLEKIAIARGIYPNFNRELTQELGFCFELPDGELICIPPAEKIKPLKGLPLFKWGKVREGDEIPQSWLFLGRCGKGWICRIRLPLFNLREELDPISNRSIYGWYNPTLMITTQSNFDSILRIAVGFRFHSPFMGVERVFRHPYGRHLHRHRWTGGME